MNLQNRFSRILLGAGLALAFAIVPSTAANAQTAKKAPASTMSAMNSSMAPLDLNTATEDQLEALPGIGDAYAKRIIAGCPYSVKNQLVSKGILTQKVYDKIKNQVTAHHAK